MNDYLESPNYSVTPDGFLICVKIEADQDAFPPWENSDCHGPVRHIGHGEKAPSEVFLSADHGWLYDFQAAVAQARKEGWSCNRPVKTKGERAHYAAMEDMAYLRRWLNNDWQYCGVVVELLAMPGGYDPDEDDPEDFTPAACESLWGVEYDTSDKGHVPYLQQIIGDLVCELLAPYRQALAA
jgi:hypothetical protein